MKEHVALSMVMLTNDSPLDTDCICRALAQLWPDLPAPQDLDTGQDCVLFNLGEDEVILAKMPLPIPWSELEGPCATSLHWQNATEEVRKHTHHVLVTVRTNLEPLPRTTLLSQVVCAVLVACPTAIGVFWGQATMVVAKELFLADCQDSLPKSTPTIVWVDCRVIPVTATTCDGFTAGLNALGYMEFETQQCPLQPVELWERLLELSSYVVNSDRPIKDGDTVGPTAKDQVRIVYSDSVFGHPERVMRLVFGERPVKKAWWKFR